MDVIRKELASLFGSALVRYNDAIDAVQTSADGGATWENNSGADPRNIRHFPPVVTDSTRCDSAARFANAVREGEELIVAQLGISAPLAGIVSQVLIWLFAPEFALLITIVYGIVQAFASFGASAIASAFSAFDWDAFTCKVYGLLDTSGQISAAQLSAILSMIATDYDGIQEDVLYNLVSLAGYGGMSDQIAIRTDSGDCVSCGEWCMEYGAGALAFNNGDWAIVASGQGSISTDHMDTTYKQFTTPAVRGYTVLGAKCVFGVTTTLTSVRIEFTWVTGAQAGTSEWAFGLWNNLTLAGQPMFGDHQPDIPFSPEHWIGSVSSTGFSINFICGKSAGVASNPGGSVQVTRVIVRGTGTAPSHAGNCE